MLPLNTDNQTYPLFHHDQELHHQSPVKTIKVVKTLPTQIYQQNRITSSHLNFERSFKSTSKETSKRSDYRAE